MPSEEDLAQLRARVDRLEEQVGRLEQMAHGVVEVVPTSWLLRELEERTHGEDREGWKATTDQPDE